MIHRELKTQIAGADVFLDIDSIEYGTDFVHTIDRVVATSEVILALVGRSWATDADGRRRLHEADDLVRREVAAALAAHHAGRTRLIPVLAPNTPMPSRDELPDDIAGFERLNAVRLSEEFLDAALARLVQAVERTLEAATAPDPAPPAAPVREDRAAAAPAPAPVVDEGAPPPLDRHFAIVAERLLDGRVVPLIGPGTSLAGAGPDDPPWEVARHTRPPTLYELARHLTVRFRLEGVSSYGGDLEQVADYAQIIAGSAPLYDELHRVFDVDFPPTPVHEALARLPELVRRAGGRAGFVAATLNVDDTLERAFAAAGESVDVVTYDVFERAFVHHAASGSATVVRHPQRYLEVDVDDRVVVVKLFGSVDRTSAQRDSYVMSIDDHIDQLVHDAIQRLPITVAATLARSHTLFLGVSPLGFGTRGVVRRMIGGRKERDRPLPSWSIQPWGNAVERELWRQWDVEPYGGDLAAYASQLVAAVEESAATRRAR